jgi:glycosyltransferase involved in cell wall biosynthesis
MNNVTVVIPYYNDQKIYQCLDNLTHEYFKFKKYKKKINIILINDGSKKVRNFPHRSIINIINLKENRGAGNARNLGLLKAKSKFVLFLDSDVIVCRNFFEKLFNIIEKNKLKKIFYCPQSYIPANKNPNLFQRYLSISWFINQTRDFKSFEMLTSFCLLVERKYFLEIGGFSDKYKSAGGEEFEIISRIKKKFIKVTDIYCYHFQDNFILRLKKLFKRSINFKDVIIHNKSIPFTTKFKFFFIFLNSFLLFFFLFFSLIFKFNFIILVFLILFHILLDKFFFAFLLKKKMFILILVSSIFKLIENSVIALGIVLRYCKDCVKRF